MFTEHTDTLMICAAVVVGAVVVAGLVRGVVARAVGKALVEIDAARAAGAALATAREEQLRARLTVNPWVKGEQWNLTKQITLMREDFDKARSIAEEAGVDITALRGHVDPIETKVALSMGDGSRREGVNSNMIRTGIDTVDPSYYAASGERVTIKPAKSRRKRKGK